VIFASLANVSGCIFSFCSWSMNSTSSQTERSRQQLRALPYPTGTNSLRTVIPIVHGDDSEEAAGHHQIGIRQWRTCEFPHGRAHVGAVPIVLHLLHRGARPGLHSGSHCGIGDELLAGVPDDIHDFFRSVSCVKTKILTSSSSRARFASELTNSVETSFFTSKGSRFVCRRGIASNNSPEFRGPTSRSTVAANSGFGRSGIGSSFAGSSETEAVSSCDGAVRQRFSSAQPRLKNIRADRGQKRRGCALCPHRLRFLKS